MPRSSPLRSRCKGPTLLHPTFTGYQGIPRDFEGCNAETKDSLWNLNGLHPLSIVAHGAQIARYCRNAEGQTACKPGSVHALSGDGWPFLWDVRCRTPRATDPGGGAETRVPVARRAAPIWSCSRWGLPCRFRYRSRGRLLPHRFTLTFGLSLESGPRAVCSLWHFPWGRPRRPLAGTVFPWSPDFPHPAGCPAERSHPTV